MLWKRLAMLPALVLVYALVAEAGLHIAAYFMQRSTRAGMPVAWVTGNLRVLCVGDSNTYGVWAYRSEAYPQQLESLWNERVASPKLEVLNLGVPGVNSSRLVHELPKMLATFAPDILIIMVGVNDFWTQPVALDDAPQEQPRAGFLERYSLLYRLYFLWQRGRLAKQPEFLMDPKADVHGGANNKIRVGGREFDMSFATARPSLKGDKDGLRRNLLKLVELARGSGASFYLMTYPARRDFYTDANQIIRDIAEQTGAPLIDLTSVFLSICPQDECPEFMFPDGHPIAPGYRVVAETVLERLRQPGPS